jgi:hypothetical protein
LLVRAAGLQQRTAGQQVRQLGSSSRGRGWSRSQLIPGRQLLLQHCSVLPPLQVGQTALQALPQHPTRTQQPSNTNMGIHRSPVLMQAVHQDRDGRQGQQDQQAAVQRTLQQQGMGQLQHMRRSAPSALLLSQQRQQCCPAVMCCVVNVQIAWWIASQQAQQQHTGTSAAQTAARTRTSATSHT